MVMMDFLHPVPIRVLISGVEDARPEYNMERLSHQFYQCLK